MTRRTFTQNATATSSTSAAPITEKQLKFIARLLRERDLGAGGKIDIQTEEERGLVIDEMQSQAAKLSRSTASKWIDRLMALPYLESKVLTPDDIDVPAGRYALPGPGQGHSTRFYRVDRPTEGRWAGRTFVKVQAGDEFLPVREASVRNSILSDIASDPKEASFLYGRELGHCGVCGRTLTDDTSRERGIGPVCAEKMGW